MFESRANIDSLAINSYLLQNTIPKIDQLLCELIREVEGKSCSCNVCNNKIMNRTMVQDHHHIWNYNYLSVPFSIKIGYY